MCFSGIDFFMPFLSFLWTEQLSTNVLLKYLVILPHPRVSISYEQF